MTNEEKDLLFKDLCARLPYHPTVKIYNDSWDEGYQIGEFDNRLWFHHVEAFVCDRVEIKPYLRPMSSMGEDEKEEFRVVGGVMSYNPQNDSWAISAFTPEAYDWLNAHHFDFRDLIEKGLALEAPEDMYKID